MRQLAVLQLQHCAILSQLNKHEGALELAQETSRLLWSICDTACALTRARTENEEAMARLSDER